MAVIYLTHPVHGAKVAIAEAEAIYDESHGWMRYNPDQDSVSVNVMPSRTRKRQPVIEPTE